MLSLKSHSAKNSPVLKAAATWLVTMNADDVSVKERQEFEKWQQNEENAAAYNALHKTWQQFDVLKDAPSKYTLKQALSRSGNKKQVLSISAFAALCLLSAHLLELDKMILSDHFALASTSQVITLADNSKVHLMPHSAINVHYSDNQRNIELVKGHVFVDVAKDAKRPFTVVTEKGSVAALGTQYSVRLDETLNHVKVYESQVMVCPMQANESACISLSAQQQTQFNDYQVMPVTTLPQGLSINWNKQLLLVDNQPLGTVISQLQQHYAGVIALDDAELKQSLVSGVFTLNDIPQSVGSLSGILPLSVTSYGPLLIKIEKNKHKK